MKYINYAYFNLWLIKEIISKCKSHSEIVLQFGWPTIPAVALLNRLRFCSWIAILVDSVITHSANDLGWSIRREGIPLAIAKRIERLARWAKFIVVVNRAEADSLIASGFARDKVKCIPIATRILERPGLLKSSAIKTAFLLNHNLPSDAKLVAFHGDLTYLPNRNAASQIVNYIAPRTHQIDHTIFFLIIGKGEVPRRVSDNVLFLGFVDDLEILLSNVDAEIVPLEMGSGLKNKIVDALNCALPVVTTKTGKSGFEQQDCPLIVAEIERFPETILDLLNNADRTKIGEKGWTYVKNHYSIDKHSEYFSMVKTIEQEVSA